jgi:hypothetical protein
MKKRKLNVGFNWGGWGWRVGKSQFTRSKFSGILTALNSSLKYMTTVRHLPCDRYPSLNYHTSPHQTQHQTHPQTHPQTALRTNKFHPKFPPTFVALHYCAHFLLSFPDFVCKLWWRDFALVRANFLLSISDPMRLRRRRGGAGEEEEEEKSGGRRRFDCLRNISLMVLE